MHKLLKIYVGLILLFLYFPIFYLIFYSFNANGDMINFTGFSLDAYIELFSDQHLLIVLVNTLLVGFISSFIATIIGFCGAMTIYNIKNKKYKSIINIANSLFLVSPDVIIGISLLTIFTFFQIKLGFFTVLLAHIAFSVPAACIIIYAKLNTFNPKLIQAGKDLGCNDQEILKLIIFPLIKTALLGAFFTAFTYSIDDFAVTFFVTGNSFTTLGIDIYAAARQGISLTINALSTIIFVITLFVALIYWIYQNKKEKNEKNNFNFNNID